MNITPSLKTKRPFSAKKISVIAVVVLAAAVGGFAVWSHSHKDEPAQVKINNGQVAVADPDVPNDTDTGSDSSDVYSNSASQPKDQNSAPAPIANDKTPNTPRGDFVSSHSSSWSGNTPMGSVCVTTPGAYCYISFTKGGVTKSLEKRMTDASGSVYWDWNIQKVGLTKGSWQVTAVAVNGSKTATASDAQNLEVQQ